jgi:hypothetical protein
MKTIHTHALCRRIVKSVKEATSLIETKLHDRIHFYFFDFLHNDPVTFQSSNGIWITSYLLDEIPRFNVVS